MQSLFWRLMTVAAFKIKYHFFINLYGFTVCSCWIRKHQLRHWCKIMFRQFESSLVFTPFLHSSLSWKAWQMISGFFSLHFSVFIYFTISLTSCLSFFSVWKLLQKRKAALTLCIFFLAPLLALFPTPQQPPSLGTLSSDLGSARTALPFHLGIRNILQLHKYSSIHFLTFWAVWSK